MALQYGAPQYYYTGKHSKTVSQNIPLKCPQTNVPKAPPNGWFHETACFKSDHRSIHYSLYIERKKNGDFSLLNMASY